MLSDFMYEYLHKIIGFLGDISIVCKDWEIIECRGKEKLANTDLFQEQSVTSAGRHFPVPMLVHVTTYVFVHVEFRLIAVE